MTDLLDRKIHILNRIEDFDNFMHCGKKNVTFYHETWVSEDEIDSGKYSVEFVDCDACRELYTLRLLADT